MDFVGSSGDATFDTTFYMPHKTVKSFGSHRYGGTAVRFDDYEDLMWTGTKEGHLSSYVGPHMKLCSSFGYLAAGGIADYCITEAGVFTVGLDRLSLYRRDGFELLHQPLYTVTNGEPLSCCLTVRNSGHILPNETVFVAGSRGLVTKVNLQRPEIVENLQVGTIDTTLMRSSDRFVCFGSSSGDLGILDVRSNQVRTHKLASDLRNLVVWDFDVHDYSLFLCANELNDDESVVPTSSILCYDLRICKATAPVTTALSPRHIRVVPDTCGQKCIVVDHMEGKYQLISSVASVSTEKNVCRISKSCSVPLSLEVSSTGQEIAIADDTGSIHVLRSAASAKSRQWNKTSLRLLPSIEVVHRRPLNNHYFQTAANVAPGFADATVSTMQSVTSTNNQKSLKHSAILRESLQGLAHGNSGVFGGSRSQSLEYIPHSPSKHLGRSGTVSVGLIEKANSSSSSVCRNEWDEPVLPSVLDCQPSYPHINGFLQCLYHIAPVSAFFQSHVCFDEFCLSCELGFLFHMMGVADTTEEPCQTSNLLRVLRALPEATERGLVASDSFVIEDVGSAVQIWVEFLMERTHLEYYSYAAQAIMQENPLTSLFAWRMLETVHHSGCNHTNQLEKNVFAVSIQYHCQTNYGTPAFDNLLKSSINEYSEWTLTCGCGLQSKTFVSRQVLSYPECIAFTFHLEDGGNVSSFAQLLKAARTTSTKLDRGLCRYGASCSRPNCFFLHPHEMNSEEKHSNEGEIPAALWIRQGFDGQTEVVTEQPADISNWLSYELSSVIHREDASGSEEKEDGCYSYTKTAPWSPWYRFGSHDVTPSTQAQAVQFDLEQKVPCVAVYVRTESEDRWPVCPINPITREVFQKFSDLTASRRWYKPGDVVAVRETETFGPYNIVALDAEFVSLAGAENENLDDSFGKPAMLSVGRVTVVRGNGPLQDQLLMDEYVVARDKVANHLTKYSGIRPGDLSLNLSLKPLDTLKSVYVRLRYLVDAGVRFVGHGISTDFKILNLRVPQAQIIDTVQLYRLPGKRLISLRFLAWYFLRLHIQELSGHDSVEDAMASLYLYRWFERNRNTMISWDDSINNVQSVTFDELLQMMYQVGRSLDWKVSPNRS